MSVFATIARAVHTLLLAFWVGGGVLFGAVMAPALFRQLPSRHLAGDVVLDVVSTFDAAALVAGPLILVCLWLGQSGAGTFVKTRSLLVVLMTALVAVNAYWVSPEMEALRQSMGRPIEDLVVSDPLRLQFASLHSASEAVMGAHLVLAAAALVLSVFRAKQSGYGGGIEL